ncbi:MAG: Do family serine endopeptidase [bacterium]|nr:Do family serine endopeptidase [bacterium]
MNRKNWFIILALVLGAFIGGIYLSAEFPDLPFLPNATVKAETQPSPAPASAKAVSGSNPSGCPSFSALAKQLSPTVVNIYTTKTVKGGRSIFRMPQRRGQGQQGDPFEEFFRYFEGTPRPEMKQRSLGSGFIISEDGYIMTNNHVIEGADEIKVILDNDKRYDAKLIGRDPKTDIALIKIEEKGLTFAPLGNSGALQVGDWVMAIGNPFGLSHTVTAGIVSAIGRIIGSGPYDNFIQTDASINFGNSGGPLINMKGEVIGINSQIVAGGQGIGFAIPINMAKDFLPQLKEKGKVTRGYLGVLIQTLTPDLADSMDLKVREGALVSQVVSGGPADKAGVKVGDVLVEFDGKKITSHHDLPAIVAITPIGKKAKVVIIRDKKEKEIFIEVGELKDEETAQAEPGSAPVNHFGIEAEELTPEIAQELGVKDRRGVVITEVTPGSQAEEVGIRQGDIIRQINRKPIQDLADYQSLMAKIGKGKSILLLIEREKQSFFVVLQE